MLTLPPGPRGIVHKLSVLVLPWLFVALLVGAYLELLLPRIHQGGAMGVVIALLAIVPLGSFAMAAVTLSRDVVTNRWPDDASN